MRTAITCITILLCSCAAWAQTAQPLTPDQAAEQLKKLPPGSSIVLERTHDGGNITVEEEASGQGAALNARGKEIVSNFNGTAPGAALGGGRSATGGDTETSNKVKGGDNLWANPLMWVGILCCLGAGVALYLRLPFRVAIIAGVAGLGFISAAIFPWILPFALGGVLLAVVGPYIYREWAHKQEKVAHAEDEAAAIKNREALRAVVAGVGDFGKAAKDSNNPTVDPTAYERLKEFIQSHALPSDDAVIKDIKNQDRV